MIQMTVTLTVTEQVARVIYTDSFSFTVHTCACDATMVVMTSVAVLAEISLRSPRKLFIFIIKHIMYRIKVSKK